MSESEAESVEAVEVEAPKKKGRPPMSEERRKQMLENLAKGRKTRAENLSNKRLQKEQEQTKKEQEHKCDYCGSQFKYKASKTKHMKTCVDNPNYKKVEDEPSELSENENVKVERKEKETIESPEMKEEKKKKKKKKVVYVSSDDSSSEEEIIYKRKKPSKRKGKVVYVNDIQPPPVQPVQPVQPAKPEITEAQKAVMMKQRQEDARYAEMGRKQEAERNRIKALSQNMVGRSRF